MFVTYAVPEKNGAEKKTAESEAEVLATLSEQETNLYGLLRKWRNDVAKEKGYGPYILFTNVQLAKIAKEKPQTLEKLGLIHGIGDSKLENYGKTVLAMVQDFCNRKQQP